MEKKVSQGSLVSVLSRDVSGIQCLPQSYMKSCHLPLGPKPSGAMLLFLTLVLLARPTCRAQSESHHLVFNLPSPDPGKRISGDEGLAVSTLLVPFLLIPFVQMQGNH